MIRKQVIGIEQGGVNIKEQRRRRDTDTTVGKDDQIRSISTK